MNPIKACDVRGHLRWHGSDAEWLLEIDINNDKHLEPATNTPMKLWKSRPNEYQLFPLEVFRKHMDQCKQAAKQFGKTPGQAKSSNHRKVGGKEYCRTSEEETGAGIV